MDFKRLKAYYRSLYWKWYWKYSGTKICFGRSGLKGAYFRYNERFFVFHWKPYSDGWFDKEGVWHKSRQFQFMTFKINQPINLGNNAQEKDKKMEQVQVTMEAEGVKHLTSEEVEKLLALKNDGAAVEFITTDEAEETDDQKVVN